MTENNHPHDLNEQTTEAFPNSRRQRRPGAGRKPVEGKSFDATVLVRMSQSMRNELRALGGSHWVRDQIRQAAQIERENKPTIAAMYSVSPQTQITVPELFTRVQAGFPSPAENYEQRPIDFNDLLVENPSATFVLRVTGDSMVDAGIFDGDLLVVDRTKTPRIGDIVIMQINNEFTVKRMARANDGTPFLRAENRSGLYRDIYPSEFEEWTCFGVVSYAIKPL